MIPGKNIWRAMAPNQWLSSYLLWFNGPFTVTVSVEIDDLPGRVHSHNAKVWIDRPQREIANHPVTVDYIGHEIHLK